MLSSSCVGGLEGSVLVVGVCLVVGVGFVVGDEVGGGCADGRRRLQMSFLSLLRFVNTHTRH